MSSSSGRVAGALPQFRLYAKAFIVVRLDQIHPYGINEGCDSSASSRVSQLFSG